MRLHDFGAREGFQKYKMVADVICEECKQESLHGSVRRTYEEMRGEKYYGTYTPVSAIPILHLRDLDLMQHVMGKKAKKYLTKLVKEDPNGPFTNDVSREGEGGSYPTSDAAREIA